MSAQRRKKVRKLRGSRTHGWGHPKKHRGKGSRGGVGKSGMGKRGQHKMSLLNSLGIVNIGSYGFKRPSAVVARSKALNLRDIDSRLDKWLKEGIATEEKNVVTLDVSKLGITKILGGGSISRKVILTADRISASAKEKIEKAGGKAEAMIIEVEEKEEASTPKAGAEDKAKGKEKSASAKQPRKAVENKSTKK